jgi:hypothetical protein
MWVAVWMLVASPALSGNSGGDLNAARQSAPGSLGDIMCDTFLNGLVSGVKVDQVFRKGGTPICMDLTSTATARNIVTNSCCASKVLIMEMGTVAAWALFQAYPYPALK